MTGPITPEMVKAALDDEAEAQRGCFILDIDCASIADRLNKAVAAARLNAAVQNAEWILSEMKQIERNSG